MTHADASALSALAELDLLLRPAAGGMFLQAQGWDAETALQRRLYGIEQGTSSTLTAEHEAQILQRSRAKRALLSSARVVLLGIPSDLGSFCQRGASFGPTAVRAALLDEDPGWFTRAEAAGLVDIGDVLVAAQLLHDDMITAAQLAATRRSMYPGVPEAVAARLPVSVLSVAERVLDLVFALNPGVKPLVIGGDHSTAWPVVAALARARPPSAPDGAWALVQSDAHTDLLPEHLGVRYCFASWGYHANELLGRGGRLVQVGTRASEHDREHWEASLGVRQFWAPQCRARPDEVIEAVSEHLRRTGVRGVYFSNDIDGTDPHFAGATGTPEPEGLDPEFVIRLVRRLGAEFGLLGGDVMEVAPGLGLSAEGSARTVKLSARYLRETAEALLGQAI